MSEILKSRSTSCLLRVAHEVASRERVEATELQPLHDYVDPDALSTIIESADEDLTIEFSYIGYSVTVIGDGSIRVTENS